MTDSMDDKTVEPIADLKTSVTRAITGLALFAIVTAGLIAVTQVNTADRIEAQVREARSKALLEIVPAAEHNNDMLSEAFSIRARELGLSELEQAFVARVDGVPVSVILPVIAPAGYTGPIKLILGIDMQGQIKGVRVIEHKETPGLGDKIELQKSDWIRAFEGRSLANTGKDQWAVKKDGGDFDQLTGATITPRAIVTALHQALEFYAAHQMAILHLEPGQTLAINPQEGQ